MHCKQKSHIYQSQLLRWMEDMSMRQFVIQQETHRGNILTSSLDLSRQADLLDLSQPRSWKSIFKSSSKPPLDAYFSTHIHLLGLQPGSISKAGDESFHTAFDAAMAALVQEASWCCRSTFQQAACLKPSRVQIKLHCLNLGRKDLVFIFLLKGGISNLQ